MKYLKLLLLLSVIINAKNISKIEEASGIDYCEGDKTFVVANDEGAYYLMNKKGKILDRVKLGKYDLEGVVCEENEYIFAIEDKGLLIVDKDTNKKIEVEVKRKYNGKKIKIFGKKSGIEGIAKHKNTIYLAKQTKKDKDSFIVVIQYKPFPSKIVDILHHKIKDTAGLKYHNNHLYMVSDKRDLLIKYSLKKRKIVKKIKLEKGAWEGITFGKKGDVYLADDDGKVSKFHINGLGL